MARRIAVPVACVALAAITFIWVVNWMRPSVRRDEIRTARVEAGPVEATISATGTVVPAYEHVITSPIESRVTRILLTPGAVVDAGRPILQLDTGETSAALEKLDDQLSLQENEREQALLDHARQKAALLTRREIKSLELQSREYEAERCRKHFDEGLFSQDEVRQAETDAERSRIELRQIDESLENLEGTLERDLQGLELELAILRKDRAETARRLELATTASDRAGVLTWVVPSEGMAVRRGEELARVADLSAFRVEATASDVHASRIRPGLPVEVQTGDLSLGGTVAGVRPMVENGVITLDVALDERSHSALRQNLRVDVRVVADRVEDSLRIPRGPYMTPDGTHAVFVIRGDRAVRTPVRFGITNIDFYQVLEGLEEGDEVIVSDMSDHMQVTEVRLQ
jgi:HlyD family secretion protein